MDADRFPISPLLPHLRASLAAHPRLLLEAPPGAGKTTQVPLALLDEAWLEGRQIVMLEPRRIAARAAADFMAAQLDEAVGQTVGYRIRFESRVSPATRIVVVTEGILTRMLQDEPELPGIGVLVFDEFHERHLAGDLGIVLALDVQASLRPDLRVIVMSATLGDGRLGGNASHGEKAPWFDAPLLRSEGRAFPVQISHPPTQRDEALAPRIARATRQALAATDGDVLVFLPGRREIAQAQRALEGLPAGIEVVTLHGDLALAEQQAVLAPRTSSAMDGSGTRRVILATNVAESSITVPGVRAVVDSGLAREPRFDPDSGLTRLATVNISRASADQRAGRAGRVAPGIAYRLWPESQRLEASRVPEIAQVELSGLALELAAWGVGADASSLRWLDAPPAGALAQARELLQSLGALDGDLRITAFGRSMLQLGTDPRLAAAALRAPAALRPLVADLLATLESRSPLHGGHRDDLRARIDALHRWRDGGARSVRDADSGVLAGSDQLARGWRRRLDVRHGASGTPDALAVGNLLLHAYPDRAARQDARDPRRYLLANGRGARLHEESALFGERWLVVVEARFDARDSLIATGAPFNPALLEADFPQAIVDTRVVAENANGTLEAHAERRYGALVLERRAVPVTADDTLPALLATLRTRGLAALPWNDATLRLRARIAWLRATAPELALPDVSDEALLASLEHWIAPALAGKRKLDALSVDELAAAFAALLDWPSRQRLDALAPDAITVPSGMTRRLDYTAALAAEAQAPAPILAVKLQELFGLAETPRIAEGRVAVMLHLLSPAGRPIQVTQDLRGFWNRTYAEVKKELKGRYPRHPWPDDPWNALPTHRAKPRR